MKKRFLWGIMGFCLLAIAAVFFQQVLEYNMHIKNQTLPFRPTEEISIMTIQFPDVILTLKKDINGYWTGMAGETEIPIRQSAVQEILKMFHDEGNVLLYENPEREMLQSLTPDNPIIFTAALDNSRELTVLTFLKISEDPYRQLVLLNSSGSIYSIPLKISELIWNESFIEDRIFPAWDYTDSVIALSISAPGYDFSWEFTAFENGGIWQTSEDQELDPVKVDTLIDGMRTLRLVSLERQVISNAMIILTAESSSGELRVLKIGEPLPNGQVPVSDGSGNVQGRISSAQLQGILLTPEELAK